MAKVKLVIDGRDGDEFSDDELVALNQRLGEKQENLRAMRIAINGELARRRARVDVERAIADAAKVHGERMVGELAERVDAEAPGAVIAVDAKSV